MVDAEEHNNKQPGRDLQKSRPRLINKFIIFSVTLFSIILVAGSAAFVFSMRQIIRTNKGNELSQMLEIERIKLETSVNNEIALVLKMAGLPLIQRYFANPYDQALVRRPFTHHLENTWANMKRFLVDALPESGSLQNGFEDFLSKPINTVKLNAILEK